MSSFLTQKAIFFFLLLSLTGAGCTYTSPIAQESSQPPASLKPVSAKPRNLALVSTSLFQVAQAIAVQLKNNVKEGQIGDWPCIVATFVDIDNLEHSSRFGRVLAEAVGTEMFRYGADIKDVRPAKALYFQPGTGELILSRDAKKLADSVSARAVITGTYTDSATSVIVNVRLIDLYNGKVISVAGEEIAKTKSIDVLLGSTGSQEESEPEPTTYDIQTL